LDIFWTFFGLVLENTFMVFLGLPMQKNGQKRDKIKPKGKDDRQLRQGEKNLNFFGQKFWPKVSDMGFPQKVFGGVFELPLLRNAQKRH
jgi:hypothetical protein